MVYAAIMVGLIIVGFFLLKKLSLAPSGNFKNITAAEAKKLLKDKNVIPLDVRTPNEITQGKIPKAKILNVASSGFVKGLQNLDKSKTYVVYCRSGNRSARACQIMGKNGFENLYNLQGGYNKW